MSFAASSSDAFSRPTVGSDEDAPVPRTGAALQTQQFAHRSIVGRMRTLLPRGRRAAPDHSPNDNHPSASTLRNAIREIRALLPEIVAISLLLALIWVSIGFILARERAHAIAAARSTSDALARAYAESTARIISEVDLTLLSARSAYMADPEHFDIEKWADRMMQDDSLRVQLAAMDEDGNTIKSTLARSNARPVNIADRPHFIFQKQSKDDELYISDPVVGRATGVRSIQFTRKLVTPDGKFDGILVLSVSCDELSQFYDLSKSDDGSVTITNARGVVIAGRSNAIKIGQKLPIATHVINYVPGESAGINGSMTQDDGHGGLISRLRIARYPLVISIYRSGASIYRAYDHSNTYFHAVGWIATLIVGLLGSFWLVQRRRVILQGNALAATLAGVSQGIVMMNNDGALSVTNGQARRMLAIAPDMPAPDITRAFIRLRNSQPVTEPLAQISPDNPDSTITEVLTDDGRTIEIRSNPLQVGGTVYTLTDVTEQHKAQSRIRYLAHHDVLTGLPNRLLLEQRLEFILEQAAASDQQVLVLFIDLDGFKSVNDTLGHLFGDKLLRHVADIIRGCLPPTAFVARLGGDEFVVVQPTTTPHETGAGLATTLINQISRAVVIDRHETRISTSIGIASYPEDGLDHHELFKKADIALYKAKGEGRATWRFFVPGMDEHLHRRILLEESLRSALEDGSLDVHYQAQFDVATQRIRGFEALARWKHPLYGWVAPSVFIAVAEECGLIARLGAFVLERACAEAAKWPDDVYVAVNVSAYQFAEVDFVDAVKKVLARTGLPAERLELELTESVMMDSGNRVIDTLQALRALGVSLALDDFGTGYSCLSNLLRFHFDKVKIDRSFVQEQLHDQNARAILEATMAIGRNIKTEIVAEGVETAEQEEALVNQGCPIIQGFHIGEPMNGKRVRKLLLAEAES